MIIVVLYSSKGTKIPHEDQAHRAKVSHYPIVCREGFCESSQRSLDLNVSDPMTKALPRAKHEQHRIAIGVRETMQTGLLTLMQVGDCWKYAIEAIILYYYISICIIKSLYFML